MPRSFEDYFKNRGAAIGPQPTAGDEALILRADTVFRSSFVYNQALMYIDENATETTINTIDIWEQMAGSWVNNVSTPTFTFASGQYTYVGPDQIQPATIHACASISKSIAGAAVYEIGVFVNGSLIGNGMKLLISDATGTLHVSCNAMKALVTGDIIDLRIRNRNDTDDVLVSDAQLVISQ